ncbi:response regulator transcription factor [Streptomyces sp. NPDC002088]|uniref:response regulator transcription factor n=1 Tax=Streptomyces sp. NPDC002088 TaxID=3154665 RepID=UPI0033348DCC
MPINVVVCEETPVVRAGLCGLLESDAETQLVDSTDSGVHAMMLVRSHRPDVLITGLSLRGFSGLDLIERLNRESTVPQPRVIVFATDGSDETVTKVLASDVHGILVWETTKEEVSLAVRAAAAGHTYITPRVAGRLVDWVRNRSSLASEMDRLRLAGLTPREMEVLVLLARGLSADEMAGKLSIGTTTVRTHLYRLQRKLELRDRAQLVSFAFQAGLME